MTEIASHQARRRLVVPNGSRARAFAPGWVWALAGAGYLQASTLLLAGAAVDVVPGARGLVGGDLVGGELHRPLGILLIALGVASLLASVLVVLGHGFALTGLLAAGTLGALVLASSASWAVFVVPVAMAVAVLLALFTPAFDHLFPARGL